MIIWIIMLLFLFRVDALAMDRAKIVELTNNKRQELGLSTLNSNDKLNQAAQMKANDILRYDYWSHVSPSGKTPWYWIRQAGYYYSVAGENLAQGYADEYQVMQAWMASPSHAANIKKASFCDIGVGVATGDFRGKTNTIVVQILACKRK